MPRGGIPVSRVQDDEPQGQRKGSSWLDNVQDMLAQKQETAVEQSRARASMISQVNNILANPSRYATVDDAVQDMRERTGLNNYLKDIRANVKNASVQERDHDGLLTEKHAKDLVGLISDSKKKIAKSADGLEIYEAGGSEQEIPEALKSYSDGAIKDIVSFIRGNIDDSHGFSSVSQIQHDILHILGNKYRLQDKDVMSGEMAKFISDFILEAKSKLGPTETATNLGFGVGQDVEEDNSDYWAGMMPSTK